MLIFIPIQNRKRYTQYINYVCLACAENISHIDEACFICEEEHTPQGQHISRQECRCPWCPNLPLSVQKPTLLVTHMGMHILHNPAVRGTHDPCGFCLKPSNICSIKVTKGKGRKGGQTVSVGESRCQNASKLLITTASRYKDNSPCTNHPLKCPLCQHNTPFVWKYNLKSHITRAHPTATLDDYKEHWHISSAKCAKLLTMYTFKKRHLKSKK